MCYPDKGVLAMDRLSSVVEKSVSDGCKCDSHVGSFEHGGMVFSNVKNRPLKVKTLYNEKSRNRIGIEENKLRKEPFLSTSCSRSDFHRLEIGL